MEKIQMTEEQFDDFYHKCIQNNMERKEILESAREEGYIKKSELEILVEEAESTYWKTVSRNGIPEIDGLKHCIDKLYEGFKIIKSQLKEYGGDR